MKIYTFTLVDDLLGWDHGNGKNCFKPKTIFRVIVQNQENNE